MHLTKIELQEMLREMGVKFSHTESYENLKKLFQEENHIRWMGKQQANGRRSGGAIKRVIRKKAASGDGKMVVLSNPPAPESGVMPESLGIHKNVKQRNYRERDRKKHLVAKAELSDIHIPSRQKHSEITDRNKDVFSTVLRRSQNRCELCGHQCDPGKDNVNGLKPFHINPLSLGGEVAVKNMVALCSDCHRRLTADAQPSDLKQLKRKARGKIIRTVQIQRKPRLQ